MAAINEMDARLISQGTQVESVGAEALIPVATAEGQPQSNITLANLADSLGQAVPQQQNAEQVVMTGLYAQTSDGKMVELTKESVAKVISGLIGFDNVAIPKGRLEQQSFFSNSLNFRQNGIYLFNANSITDGSSPVTSSSLWVIENKKLYGNSDYLVQLLYSVGLSVCYIRFVTDTSFGTWRRIDNFGANTEAELASMVAGVIGFGFRTGTLNVRADELHQNAILLNSNYDSTLPSAYGTLITFVPNTSHVTQLYSVADSDLNDLYFRHKTSGIWSSWRKI